MAHGDPDTEQAYENENERELERIFEEKLYVNKKRPLRDVSNTPGKRMGDPAVLGGKLELSREATLNKADVVPQTELEGFYDDLELQDVLKTKEMLAGNKEEGTDPGDKQTRSFSKEKIRRLEREFQNMIQTHKETLKMKSKVYRFIYNEIHALRVETAAKTEKLEEENKKLREEVGDLRADLERVKGEFEMYNTRVAERVKEWKKAVEARVVEYLKRRRPN